MATTMRAIGYTAASEVDDERAFVERSIGVPDLRPHDLLVEVRAVSVNPVDVKTRASTDPQGFRVLGFDAAGVVVGIGSEVSLFAVGDPVFYAGALDRPGANAELHAVDERIVGRKPASLDFAEAAVLPLTSLTAYEGLVGKLRLSEASRGTLLVVGAAGGVGSVVLQLAKALAPEVRIVGTASRSDSAARARDLGADLVVDHRGDLAANLLAAVPDGVDWIFTTASARPGAVGSYVQVLRPFGAVVAIDDPETLDVVSLKPKALSWHWEFMFARSLQQAPDMIEQHRILDRIADLVDAGLLRIAVAERLSPLDAEQLREAHRSVESGSTPGRVAVVAG